MSDGCVQEAYIPINIYVHTHTHTNLHACTHTHIYIYLYACIHTHTHTRANKHMYKQINDNKTDNNKRVLEYIAYMQTNKNSHKFSKNIIII